MEPIQDDPPKKVPTFESMFPAEPIQDDRVDVIREALTEARWSMENGEFPHEAKMDEAIAALDRLVAARDRLTKERDVAWEGIGVLKAERDRLIQALRAVKNRKNQVCADYMECTHVGCSSSYEAFAIADEALTKATEEPKELPWTDPMQGA
jgi:uncharacterized coiled-coil DUF342 family protein